MQLTELGAVEAHIATATAIFYGKIRERNSYDLVNCGLIFSSYQAVLRYMNLKTQLNDQR